MEFKKTMINGDSVPAISESFPDYEVMLISILDAMIERYLRNPDDSFIDTKLNIITGKDFPEANDVESDFRGRTAVFGWIQGRALESLVGHALWLPECTILNKTQRQDRVTVLNKMIEALVQTLEDVRLKNSGHLFFMFTPHGSPFIVDENRRRKYIEINADAPFNTSDLFYAKAMIAAADYLQDERIKNTAMAYFRDILNAMDEGTYTTDQISFDPKNKVQPVPGKHTHGSRMVALSGLATAARVSDDPFWTDIGCRFIRETLEYHVHHGDDTALKEYDLFEAIDNERKPWKDDGRILSDPGHSLEFVGLATKFLLELERRSATSDTELDILERCRREFPEIFIRNLANGFNPEVGGICKAFDLISRKPINSDMPWWNLPETLRAGAELLLFCPEMDCRSEILRGIRDCSNGFFRSFVNPKVHLMAYQTIDRGGRPVDVVPATPDADPGYHTGLSIIDFLECMKKLRASTA